MRRARARIIDKSLVESGDLPRKHPTATADRVNFRRADEARWRGSAKLMQRSGRSASARSSLRSAGMRSRDDSALRRCRWASTRLNGLRRDKPERVRSPPPRAHLLSNRHWPEARARLLFITDLPLKVRTAPRRSIRLAITLYREEKYDEAIKWFERAHTEFLEERKVSKATTMSGPRFRKPDATKTPARRYSEFINAYPDERPGRGRLSQRSR